MSVTPTNRKYAWALQTDYATQKVIAAAALKQLLVTDNNFLDYKAIVNTNEDWSHGVNGATDQWLEAHDVSVAHTMPGFVEEMGKIFLLTLGNYGVATPPGGTIAKQHTFKPTDPNVTRQNRAVTYVEKLGAGWHKLCRSMVADGWTLKGDGTGFLTLDFNLTGSGSINNAPIVTYPPTAAPTVTNLTGLNKFYNTQVGMSFDDGNNYVGSYACDYRSFEVAYKMSMLSDAGYKPGCGNFQIPGDPTSGIIRSAHEFDKQMIDFNFAVDLPTDSEAFSRVMDQKPLLLQLTATAGIIEAGQNNTLNVQINAAKYSTGKPTINSNIANLSIEGKGFFDPAAVNPLVRVDLVNSVASYLTTW